MFMTALSDVEAKLRAFEVGAVDYVTKPFVLREMLLRVRALLRRGPTQPAGADVVTIKADLATADWKIVGEKN